MGVYSEIAADLREDVQERITEMQNAAVLAARRADERQQRKQCSVSSKAELRRACPPTPSSA